MMCWTPSTMRSRSGRSARGKHTPDEARCEGASDMGWRTVEGATCGEAAAPFPDPKDELPT